MRVIVSRVLKGTTNTTRYLLKLVEWYLVVMKQRELMRGITSDSC